jgi:hypothetical protein
MTDPAQGGGRFVALLQTLKDLRIGPRVSLQIAITGAIVAGLA